MAKLIQDVIPRYHSLATTPSAGLIATLYIRGVTIKEIFGQYYEYESHRDAVDDELFGNDEDGQHGAPPLTVADAELAGLASLPPTPLHRQPF